MHPWACLSAAPAVASGVGQVVIDAVNLPPAAAAVGAFLSWTLWIVLLTIGFGLTAGTLLSLTRHPHWIIRNWDFPRVQISLLVGATAVLYALFYARTSWWDWAFVAMCVAVLIYQLWSILPYTSLHRKSVQDAPAASLDGNTFRIVISNVQMENDQYQRWLDTVLAEDPDVIVSAEVNERWLNHIDERIRERLPHALRQPQDNWYGLALWSRLPFVRHEVLNRIQPDVPSFKVELKLRDGTPICLHALHPRPPEPARDTSSAPRDAELIIVGREIDREKQQRDIGTIVVGDLNDVAWSRTTELFRRISGMLDPRRGRGMYNSFNADSSWMRFPLDHVFHSEHFQLVDLRLLDHVGSDHFPVSVTLAFNPTLSHEQRVPEADAEDLESAEARIEAEVEREEDGKEQGHLSETPEGQHAHSH